MQVGPRSAPILALAWASASYAGDPDIALTTYPVNAVGRLESSTAWYGWGIAGVGDLNADGYDDVVIGAFEQDRAYLFLGTSHGVDETTELVLTSAWDTSAWLSFGLEVSGAGDLDGDGYDDLAVGSLTGGTSTSYGAVNLYYGSPIGTNVDEQSRIYANDVGDTPVTEYGYFIASAGDIDADGYDDLVVGADLYQDGPSPLNTYGAAYVYFGSASGVSTETEVRLARSVQEAYDAFGGAVAGGKDLDGDGLPDVVVSCVDYNGLSQDWENEHKYCSTIYVYPGGSRAIDEVEPVALQATDISNQEDLEWYGKSVALPGDIDGDGYGDLLSSALDRAYAYYGGIDGPDLASEQRIDDQSGVQVALMGAAVAGLDDLDGDGFNDIAVQCAWDYSQASVCLFMGSPDGVDLATQRVVTSPGAPDYDGFGFVLANAGDTNGDGHTDLLAGAYGADGAQGAAYIVSPACDWYLDADGDGYGDPAFHVQSCYEQSGYVPNDLDCDDTDPASYGDTWYLDADGDGYGTAAGEVLACAQPAGSSKSWLDCDDTDATTHPEATEIAGDGIDQDCNGKDAAPGPGDTGLPADTGSPSDTGTSGDDGGGEGEGNGEDDGGPADQASPPPPQGCQCASSSGPAGPALLALLALATMRRRRTARFYGVRIRLARSQNLPGQDAGHFQASHQLSAISFPLGQTVPSQARPGCPRMQTVQHSLDRS